MTFLSLHVPDWVITLLMFTNCYMLRVNSVLDVFTLCVNFSNLGSDQNRTERSLPESEYPWMACEYFSSASANCPFLNSRFPSFFSRDRCGGRAPHGAFRLTLSSVLTPPALLRSSGTEAVDAVWLEPLATLSFDSCGTLYLSEMPPLLFHCPWWWELLDSVCGPPSPLLWGFFWALPMSSRSAGAAKLSSPPTGWLGWTGRAGRERGRERWGEAGGRALTGRSHVGYITVGGGGSSKRELQEVLNYKRAWQGRGLPTAPNKTREFPLFIAQHSDI